MGVTVKNNLFFLIHSQVYICGGFLMDDPLSSCECYNPDTNQWTLIPHMETARTAAGVIAYNDQLYVVRRVKSTWSWFELGWNPRKSKFSVVFLPAWWVRWYKALIRGCFL